MTLDSKAAEYTLSGLRPFVAVTTVEGRTKPHLTVGYDAAASVPEAPRVTISLTKYNLTHDMVLNSGVFVMHLLAATPEPALDASLNIIMGLGGSSGRDGDKISQFDTKPGVTGSPILLDALSYVEGRVVASLDVEESTIFVADVVGAERLREGERLRIGAWAGCPRSGSSSTRRTTSCSLNAAATCCSTDGPTYDRDEVEAAFRHYFLTGPVREDWIAWSPAVVAGRDLTTITSGVSGALRDRGLSRGPHGLRLACVLAAPVVQHRRLADRLQGRQPGGQPRAGR
jgi:flavin reductase (DIM6/NTAB) family NADH-FMN oxidoreductase RutF